MNTTHGFTLLELLISIAIIGLLAGVLVPNVLNVKEKANVISADSVGRSVLSGMAQTEIDGTGAATCTYAGSAVTIVSTPNREVVNAPDPIRDVVCASTPSSWEVTITYANRGTQAVKTYIANK